MRTLRYEDIEVNLKVLARTWKPARVSLWETHFGEAHFVAGSWCRQADVEAALVIWHKKWRRLEARTVIREDGAVYHPVHATNGALVGFVQAVGDTGSHEQDPDTQVYVDAALRGLALALTSPVHDLTPEREDVAALRANKTGEAPHVPVPAVFVLASADKDEIRRTRTVAALKRVEWNASAAARQLGVTRQTIWRRMQHYFIARPTPSPFAPKVKRR